MHAAKKLSSLKRSFELRFQKELKALCFQKGSASFFQKALFYTPSQKGKRLRPLLALLFGKLFAAPPPAIYQLASSLELIHNFSLIHDDLPSMDDDSLRRGKPTCHEVFSAPIALLAGNTLFAMGIQTFEKSRKWIQEPVFLRSERFFFQAIGAIGLHGGQALETFWKQNASSKLTLRDLFKMYEQKTGKLFQCATHIPLLWSRRRTSRCQRVFLNQFSKDMGILFQILDDLEESEFFRQPKKAPIFHIAKYISKKEILEKHILPFQKKVDLFPKYFSTESGKMISFFLKTMFFSKKKHFLFKN